MNKVFQIGISVIATAAVISVGFSQPTLSRDFALATSFQPEHFTELYFNNLLSLPPVVQKGQPQKLWFTIANHESSRTYYEYRISIIENGQVKTTTGSTLISSEQATRLPVTFTAAKAGEAIEIIVELPAQHQAIHFRSKS